VLALSGDAVPRHHPEGVWFQGQGFGRGGVGCEHGASQERQGVRSQMKEGAGEAGCEGWGEVHANMQHVAVQDVTQALENGPGKAGPPLTPCESLDFTVS
jgi:hypothetical protein